MSDYDNGDDDGDDSDGDDADDGDDGDDDDDNDDTDDGDDDDDDDDDDYDSGDDDTDDDGDDDDDSDDDTDNGDDDDGDDDDDCNCDDDGPHSCISLSTYLFSLYYHSITTVRTPHKAPLDCKCMVLPISKVGIESFASIHAYIHTTIYTSSIIITIIVIITIITIGSFTLQRVVIKAIHDSSPSSLSSQHGSLINPSDSDSDSKHFVAIVPSHASFAVITSPHGEMTRLRLQLVVDEALPASSGRVVVISNLCEIVTYGEK